MNVITDGGNEMKTRVIVNQESVQDVKYQNIIYFKNNRHEYISGLKQLPIDFLKATSEMKTLDYTFSRNFIGFSRQDNTVLLRRKSETKWSAEVPIFEGDKWTGFGWFAYSDTNTISDMLRLFFEEVSWFGMLSWKMGRIAYD